MRAIRVLLALAGVAAGLWGVWLMRDFASEQLVSTGIWLAVGVIVHDFVLAPLTVAVGVLAVRVLPGRLRAPVGIAFLLWATLSVTFFAVLSGQGGKPDNSTILGRPYVLSWLVLTVVLVVATIIVERRRRRTDDPATRS